MWRIMFAAFVGGPAYLHPLVAKTADNAWFTISNLLKRLVIPTGIEPVFSP